VNEQEYREHLAQLDLRSRSSDKRYVTVQDTYGPGKKGTGDPVSYEQHKKRFNRIMGEIDPNTLTSSSQSAKITSIRLEMDPGGGICLFFGGNRGVLVNNLWEALECIQKHLEGEGFDAG
jgi:hypothetical protein